MCFLWNCDNVLQICLFLTCLIYCYNDHIYSMLLVCLGGKLIFMFLTISLYFKCAAPSTSIHKYFCTLHLFHLFISLSFGLFLCFSTPTLIFVPIYLYQYCYICILQLYFLIWTTLDRFVFFCMHTALYITMLLWQP